MSTIYITMGQQHCHRLPRHTIDKDCVVAIKCKDEVHGRDTAFELFGPNFALSYYQEPPDMQYFYRGIIEVN